jgi:D-alanyl-D-alanine dipeptidase
MKTLGGSSLNNSSPLQKLQQQIKQSGIKPAVLALEKTMTTRAVLSYRCQFIINECRQELLEIKNPIFLLANPHPHISIGAPYGHYSPFCVREGIFTRLNKAQSQLTLLHPGFKLQLYDAYRPLAVQKFMVNHEFDKLCRRLSIAADTIDKQTRQSLMDQVLTVWAQPDTNPLCPPPHSTGAAVDLSIIDKQGKLLNMGSAIDAIGAVSLPNHFAQAKQRPQSDYHRNRELLNRVMTSAGFRRLAHEWWHFSYGDQIWAMLQWLDNPDTPVHAIYGRVESM